eukprot:scaffold1411_cov252-Pinguiococcus_pyrenoidosus.AAC.17
MGARHVVQVRLARLVGGLAFVLAHARRVEHRLGLLRLPHEEHRELQAAGKILVAAPHGDIARRLLRLVHQREDRPVHKQLVHQQGGAQLRGVVQSAGHTLRLTIDGEAGAPLEQNVQADQTVRRLLQRPLPPGEGTALGVRVETGTVRGAADEVQRGLLPSIGGVGVPAPVQKGQEQVFHGLRRCEVQRRAAVVRVLEAREGQRGLELLRERLAVLVRAVVRALSLRFVAGQNRRSQVAVRPATQLLQQRPAHA